MPTQIRTVKLPLAIAAILFSIVAATISCAEQPDVISVEAYHGKPMGVGRVTFRMPSSSQLIAETGAIRLSDAQNRITCPVVSGGFFARIAGSGEADTERRIHVWFIFTGEEPLTLKLHGKSSVTFKVRPIAPRRPIVANVLRRQWWREFNKIFDDNEDYPPAFEVYLAAMLANRYGLTPMLDINSIQNSNKMKLTLDLMFNVESVRARAIRDLLMTEAEPEFADQPLPPPTSWNPCPVGPPAVIPKIEPIAKCVPRECFYVRFGNWGNQTWLKKLMAEYSGDLSRMIDLRGYQYPGQENLFKQLAIESSELDDLLGGNVVADVAFIGTDFYTNDGAALGVVFESKSDLFKKNLIGRRKGYARKQKADGATIDEVDLAGTTATFLHTPDNRLRSFLVSHENIHLVTNSRYIAERFVQSAKGDNNLAAQPEFQNARNIFPLERDDTIFAFLSCDFFHHLLSPKYQIELRRRSLMAAEVQIFQLAALFAKKENLDEDDTQEWIRAGLLPKNFGNRVDGSQVSFVKDSYVDSLRGARGFMIPIPDMPLDKVSEFESKWYSERADFYESSIGRFDPLFGAVKRYSLANDVERLVIDARLAPFGKQKYGWLIGLLGPATELEFKPAPNDAVSFEASLQGGLLFPRVEPHLVFAAIQDDSVPETNLRPTSVLELFKTLQSTPGYLGATPKPGYLDILPRLGGEPDEDGFTYSRLLKLWRLQFEEMSLLSFEKSRLEAAKGQIETVPSKREAQVRLEVRDLTQTKLLPWVNSLNYKRAWQTSITNVRLLNTLINQFGVEPDQAKAVAENVLGIKMVCNLGGKYGLEKLDGGNEIWVSDAWPDFQDPKMPDDYVAPIMTWFRGARIELKHQQDQFVAHGWIDIKRKSGNGIKLPGFKMFQGFGKVKALPSANSKRKEKPKAKKKEKNPKTNDSKKSQNSRN